MPSQITMRSSVLQRGNYKYTNLTNKNYYLLLGATKEQKFMPSFFT